MLCLALPTPPPPPLQRPYHPRPPSPHHPGPPGKKKLVKVRKRIPSRAVNQSSASETLSGDSSTQAPGGIARSVGFSRSVGRCWSVGHCLAVSVTCVSVRLFWLVGISGRMRKRRTRKNGCGESHLSQKNIGVSKRRIVVLCRPFLYFRDNDAAQVIDCKVIMLFFRRFGSAENSGCFANE